MKKLAIFLTMVVFSLGLMSACPEKKDEEPAAPQGDTMKTDENTDNTTEGKDTKTDGDESGQADEDVKDTTTSSN